MRTLVKGLLALIIVALPVMGTAAPKEYILTGAKPNKLFLIDAKTRLIVRNYTIPGPGIAPGSIDLSPDQKIAYIVTNHTKDIVGIDLATGTEVFRAAMSHGDEERAVNMGMAVNPVNGKIYSYEIPVLLKSDHYEVQPNRISVYAPDAGLEAAPETVLGEVPRRIHLLLLSKDGKKLYALGWDFYTMDPATGKILSTYPLRNWKRPNASQPDLLNFWPMPETSGVFTSPITYMRTDLKPDNPNAFVTGLLTLDLKSGKFDVTPIKGVNEILFTVTLSPDKKFGYGGFLGLNKIDMKKRQGVKRVELDHSFYQFNVSLDGSEVYIGGTMCDLMIYSATDLAKKDTIKLPDCPDMAGSALRVIKIDLEG